MADSVPPDHGVQKNDAPLKNAPTGKGRRGWRRWVVPPLAMMLLIGAAGYALTATGPGLRLAVGFAEGPVSEIIDGDLKAAGVSGSLWSELRVDSVSVRLPDGFSFAGTKLQFSWQPSALFNERLEIEAIGAEQISLSVPEASEPQPGQGGDTFAIPQLPLRVAIRKLDFPSVAVTAPDGSQYQASVVGEVSTTDRNELRTTIDVAADLDGRAVDRIELDAVVGPGDEPSMSMTLAGHMPADGIFHALLDLPGDLRRPLTVSHCSSSIVRIMSRTLPAS